MYHIKNAMYSSIRQALLSARFLLGAVAITAIIFLASIDTIVEAFRTEELLDNGFHGRLIYNALSSDSILFFVPIVCTLPYTAAYVEDVKSNYVRYCVYRSSRRAYIISRVAGCALSGGAVLIVGIFAAYGISALIFLPLEEAAEQGTQYLWFRQIIFSGSFVFLSGAFWSLLGMFVSSIIESKYIAYASPFVVYYILIILHERYFDSIFIIYPKQCLNPSEEWLFGKWGAAILILELTVMIAVLFYVNADRRLKQL